ncbi:MULTISPECIES: hypothetical protein [Vibrio]|uniref:Heat shock protein C n=2 Tax=Vibrio TaxID=662 RepID=A0A0H3ZSW7_9VIBR|nr:hypothetical protein [Vibrio genomosp. F6]AKN39478.1 Heat shock protein C [Vibrio genomosp. F6]
MATNRLFNLPDNAVQHWKSFQYDNKEFDFGHLDALKVTFQHPNRNERYTLFFTFSHHTFTRSIRDDETPERVLLYPYPVDLRVFDLTRYELSRQLPRIIETLPEQFTYHGGYSRYCSCKLTQEDGSEVYYQVVYRVWKERGKLRFHVESAYPLPAKPGKVKKVSFWVICHNLLTGKRLPQPGR